MPAETDGRRTRWQGTTPEQRRAQTAAARAAVDPEKAALGRARSLAARREKAKLRQAVRELLDDELPTPEEVMAEFLRLGVTIRMAERRRARLRAALPVAVEAEERIGARAASSSP